MFIGAGSAEWGACAMQRVADLIDPEGTSGAWSGNQCIAAPLLRWRVAILRLSLSGQGFAFESSFESGEEIPRVSMAMKQVLKK